MVSNMEMCLLLTIKCHAGSEVPTRTRESIRVKIRAKFHLRESMWIHVRLTKTCYQNVLEPVFKQLV